MTNEQLLSRYSFNRSTDRIGNGTAGTVIKAYDNQRDCWVALKISAVTSESTRLSREVEIVKSLGGHANIAAYDDCLTLSDTTGETDIAVMQYYANGSLADMLNRNELPADQINSILTQILEGIRFLHSHRIIHRDLKPGNILMARRPDGTYVPKIADFGISQLIDIDDTDSTVTAAATVTYASPEQLNGKRLQLNSDLWSFGVIAYRVLTGRLPFTSRSFDPNSMAGRAEIIHNISAGILPPDIDRLPAPWNMVVMSCLIPDPVRRASDAQSIIEIINSHGGACPPPPVTPPVQPPTTDKQGASGKRDNSWITRMVFIVSAVLLIFLIYIIVSGLGREKEPPVTIPTWDHPVTDGQSYSNEAPADASAEEYVTLTADTVPETDMVSSDQPVVTEEILADSAVADSVVAYSPSYYD